MKLREHLQIAPRPVRTAARIVVSCAAFVGLVAGFFAERANLIEQRAHNYIPPFSGYLPVLAALGGLVAGLFVGCLFAALILALGYVYGDARRRNMPAVLWTLVALFVPNLLGFLLYFVLRKPIASPCPQCGQPFPMDQRFCSWCGYQQPLCVASAAPPSDPANLNPNPLR
jgi:hypothetical protein